MGVAKKRLAAGHLHVTFPQRSGEGSGAHHCGIITGGTLR